MDKIILSDLDGTILSRDSYFRSLLVLGNMVRAFIFFPVFLLILLGYFLKIYDRSYLKKRSFYFVYKGVSKTKIAAKRDSFISSLKINQAVLNKIYQYRDEGYKIYIVSASPDIYVNEICQKLGFDGYICTKVVWDSDGKLSGELASTNCIYDQKVKRVNQELSIDKEAEIVAFGNSKGDYDMFKMAKKYYLVNKNGEMFENFPLNLSS